MARGRRLRWIGPIRRPYARYVGYMMYQGKTCYWNRVTAACDGSRRPASWLGHAVGNGSRRVSKSLGATNEIACLILRNRSHVEPLPTQSTTL